VSISPLFYPRVSPPRRKEENSKKREKKKKEWKVKARRIVSHQPVYQPSVLKEKEGGRKQKKKKSRGRADPPSKGTRKR